MNAGDAANVLIETKAREKGVGKDMSAFDDRRWRQRRRTVVAYDPAGCRTY